VLLFGTVHSAKKTLANRFYFLLNLQRNDLKKTVLFTIVAILYILTPVCVLGALGTMVSKKYEVDESYWKINSNNLLSAEQKAEQVKRLDRKGREMQFKAWALGFLAFVTFVTATGLLIKRNRIVAP
jgi:hypothetical protein